MTTEQKSAYEQMPDFLQRMIDEEIEDAIDEELEKVQERIERRKSQIITGVLLRVQKQINIQQMGDTLQVSVRLEK